MKGFLTLEQREELLHELKVERHAKVMALRGMGISLSEGDLCQREGDVL